MRKLLLTASAIVFAGAAQAAELTGKTSVDFTQTDGTVGASSALSFGLAGDSAGGSVGLKVDSTDNIYLDRWNVSGEFGGVALSYGDQKDVFQLGAGLNEVGGDTLANPAEAATSLTAGFGGVTVLVGIGDASSDVTDIANIQAAGTFAGATLVMDYNLTSEDVTLGAAYTLAGINLAATYSDILAYEVGYGIADYGVSLFANGDQDNMLQNVGAGYTTKIGGASFYAEAGYNVDSGDITPAAGLSFSF